MPARCACISARRRAKVTFPGIVVMQHQGGVDKFIQQITQRLAQAGYLAAAPDLYHRDGPDCQDDIAARRSRLSDRRIINDVAATVAISAKPEWRRRARASASSVSAWAEVRLSDGRHESGIQGGRNILPGQHFSSLGTRHPVTLRANLRHSLSAPSSLRG